MPKVGYGGFVNGVWSGPRQSESWEKTYGLNWGKGGYAAPQSILDANKVAQAKMQANAPAPVAPAPIADRGPAPPGQAGFTPPTGFTWNKEFGQWNKPGGGGGDIVGGPSQQNLQQAYMQALRGGQTSQQRYNPILGQWEQHITPHGQFNLDWGTFNKNPAGQWTETFSPWQQAAKQYDPMSDPNYAKALAGWQPKQQQWEQEHGDEWRRMLAQQFAKVKNSGAPQGWE